MTLFRVIEYCLHLKISVVNQDEKESDLRKILNFGHTLGHALESMGKFQKFTHGEAVVYGIFFIFNYAYSKNLITFSYYRLAIDLLNKYGFKSFSPNKDFQPEKIVNLIKKDKKASQDKITFIIPIEKKKVKELQLTPAEVLELL